MMCVLNEEEFLDDIIPHALSLVDKLVISEGGVYGNPFSDKDGHSIDSTTEIIQRYIHEYGNRIVYLTSKPGKKWKDKQLQQNAMLQFTDPGDWCFIFGADEFYDSDTREKLERLIDEHPYISEFVFSMLHLWDMGSVLTIKKDYRLVRRHQRFFKKQPEMFYTNHPTINDSQNRDTFFNDDYTEKKMYLDIPEDMIEPEDDSFKVGHWNTNPEDVIITYHYGFCRDQLHRMWKHIYQTMREKEKSYAEVIDFIRMHTGNEPQRLMKYLRDPGTFITQPYDDEHPLKNKPFVNSNIDLDSIQSLVGAFDETAKR